MSSGIADDDWLSRDVLLRQDLFESNISGSSTVYRELGYVIGAGPSRGLETASESIVRYWRILVEDVAGQNANRSY